MINTNSLQNIVNKSEIVKGKHLFPLFLVCLLYPAFYSTELFNNQQVAALMPYMAITIGILIVAINIPIVRIGRVEVLLFFYLVIMFLSTFVNNGDMVKVVAYGCRWLIIALIVKLYIERETRFFIKWCAFIFCGYIILNAIIMVGLIPSHPNGFYSADTHHIWYLGQKNSVRNYAFPAIALALIYETSIKKRKPVLSIVMFLISESTMLYIDSATPAVVLLLSAAFIILFGLYPKHLNPKIIVAVYIAVFALALSITEFEVFGNFLSIYMDRDITLSGRTILWDQAINSIIQNPILGVGLQDVTNLHLGSWLASHPHNAAIEILYRYGFFAFGISVWILLKAIGSLFASRESNSSFILTMLLGAFLLCGIFGELGNSGFILTLFLCVNSVVLRKNLSENRIGRFNETII